jgi:hypothetical protein
MQALTKLTLAALLAASAFVRLCALPNPSQFPGLLHEARERLPGLECARVRTVITVPASLNADARQETRDAAVEAGLNADLVELIDDH